MLIKYWLIRYLASVCAGANLVYGAALSLSNRAGQATVRDSRLGMPLCSGHVDTWLDLECSQRRPCIDAGAEALTKTRQRPAKREALKMKSKSIRAITIVALLVALGGMALAAQDKYALTTSSGVAFSDFKGYEGWEVVSVARTDEVLKVIVANPMMIDAYRAGVPDNGQPFPDGSKIAKLQWKPKKSTEAPFVVEVPDTFAQAFFIEKDSKRFSKSAGWGYALFNYDVKSDIFTADPSPSDCGHACHTIVAAKDYIFHPYQKR